MNKRQKEIQQVYVDNEKQVLNDLKKIYQEAEKQIDDKIAELLGRTDIQNLQSIVYQVEYQKALKKQIDAILDTMDAKQFTNVSDYLQKCYEDGYLGTMYDLNGQGIPIISPINQEQVEKALVNDTKLSEPLYEKMGKNTTEMKRKISSSVSRGFATASSYLVIARDVANQTRIGMNKSMRIARTEGNRIQNEAAIDAQYRAKEKGADIVKQWDATLDGRTRPSHAMVDGEIRELDEKFSNGLLFPGDPSGSAVEVCNCRCKLLQRAKCALDDENESFMKWDGINEELLNLHRKDYEDFKKAYRKMVENNQTINSVTESLLQKAKSAENKITSDLQSIVKKSHGTIDYDVGNGKTSLDFRLKSGSSLKRKITSDFVVGKDLSFIESHTYDVVRYTCLIDKKNLVDDYKKITHGLEQKGHKIARVKNTLGDSSKSYRGLNIVVESQSGYKYELQFHTPESIKIKEKVHILYEKQRLDSTSKNEKLLIDKKMKDISKTLPGIEKVDQIKNFDYL